MSTAMIRVAIAAARTQISRGPVNATYDQGYDGAAVETVEMTLIAAKRSRPCSAPISMPVIVAIGTEAGKQQPDCLCSQFRFEFEAI